MPKYIYLFNMTTSTNSVINQPETEIT